MWVGHSCPTPLPLVLVLVLLLILLVLTLTLVFAVDTNQSQDQPQRQRRRSTMHPAQSGGGVLSVIAIFRQLPTGTPVAKHLSTDPVSSDLKTPDWSEQNAGNPERNGRAVTWYVEFGFWVPGAWQPTIPNAYPLSIPSLVSLATSSSWGNCEIAQV